MKPFLISLVIVAALLVELQPALANAEVISLDGDGWRMMIVAMLAQPQAQAPRVSLPNGR